MKTLKQLTAVALALTLSFSAFGCAGSADGKNDGKNAGKDESMNGLEISDDESSSIFGDIDLNEQYSDNPSENNSSSALNGTYIPLEGVYNHRVDYSQDIDEAIAERIEYFTTPLKDDDGNIENDEALPIKLDSLDFYGSNKFLSISNSGQLYRHSGEYEIDDGKLFFEYHCCVLGNYGYIDEEGELTTPWEPNWTDPVYVGSATERPWTALDEKMQEWNKSGTYCYRYYGALCGRYTQQADTLKTYPRMDIDPFAEPRVTTSEQTYVYLKPIDDFLCVDTYGFELEGEYKKGDDFEITYSYYDVLCDNPQSDYNFYGMDDDALEGRLESRYSYYYNQDYKDNKDTSIKFYDGKWEWYNANGELINNGEYLESDEYEGFISMFQTEDSLNYYPEIDYAATAMIFYIDGGEVYYPMLINAGDYHDVVYIEALDDYDYDYEPPTQDEESEVDERTEIFRNANGNAKTVYTAASTYLLEYGSNPMQADGETPKTAPSAGALCGNVATWNNQTYSISDAINKYLGSNNEGLYWAVYCNDFGVAGAFIYDEDNNVIGSYPSAIDPELFPEDFDIPQGGTADDTIALRELYSNAFNGLQTG